MRHEQCHESVWIDGFVSGSEFAPPPRIRPGSSGSLRAMVVYVVVSGLPGSGKSTLARPLAKSLGLPLISKDTVKEALASAEGSDTVSSGRSRHLGAAAFEVVFALAAESNGAVLEASWHPDPARERLNGLPGVLLEVHCACPPDLARTRYVSRAGDRHSVHLDSTRFEDPELWSPHRTGALALSSPVIEVDCTTPVDVAQVVHSIKDHPAWKAAA